MQSAAGPRLGKRPRAKLPSGRDAERYRKIGLSVSKPVKQTHELAAPRMCAPLVARRQKPSARRFGQLPSSRPSAMASLQEIQKSLWMPLFDARASALNARLRMPSFPACAQQFTELQQLVIEPSCQHRDEFELCSDCFVHDAPPAPRPPVRIRALPRLPTLELNEIRSQLAAERLPSTAAAAVKATSARFPDGDETRELAVDVVDEYILSNPSIGADEAFEKGLMSIFPLPANFARPPSAPIALPPVSVLSRHLFVPLTALERSKVALALGAAVPSRSPGASLSPGDDARSALPTGPSSWQGANLWWLSATKDLDSAALARSERALEPAPLVDACPKASLRPATLLIASKWELGALSAQLGPAAPPPRAVARAREQLELMMSEETRLPSITRRGALPELVLDELPRPARLPMPKRIAYSREAEPRCLAEVACLAAARSRVLDVVVRGGERRAAPALPLPPAAPRSVTGIAASTLDGWPALALDLLPDAACESASALAIAADSGDALCTVSPLGSPSRMSADAPASGLGAPEPWPSAPYVESAGPAETGELGAPESTPPPLGSSSRRPAELVYLSWPAADHLDAAVVDLTADDPPPTPMTDTQVREEGGSTADRLAVSARGVPATTGGACARAARARGPYSGHASVQSPATTHGAPPAAPEGGAMPQEDMIARFMRMRGLAAETPTLGAVEPEPIAKCDAGPAEPSAPPEHARSLLEPEQRAPPAPHHEAMEVLEPPSAGELRSLCVGDRALQSAATILVALRAHFTFVERDFQSPCLCVSTHAAAIIIPSGFVTETQQRYNLMLELNGLRSSYDRCYLLVCDTGVAGAAPNSAELARALAQIALAARSLSFALVPLVVDSADAAVDALLGVHARERELGAKFMPVVRETALERVLCTFFNPAAAASLMSHDFAPLGQGAHGQGQGLAWFLRLSFKRQRELCPWLHPAGLQTLQLWAASFSFTLSDDDE